MKLFLKRTAFSLLLTGALVATGCTRDKEPEIGNNDPTAATPDGTVPQPGPNEGTTVDATTSAAGATATVALQGSPDDSDFSGTVTLTQEGNGVRIVADLQGVDVAGKHGFHVHENGDCSHAHEAGGKHFTSAGSHFNPTGSEHACPPTEPRHAGDLGNIEVGANGAGRMEMTTTGLSLSGPNSVVGKAIILHAKADDCKTQPTGDAGDRLACGVVTMSGGTGQ